MWNRIWKISSLKYLTAFLIPLIFIMLINQGLDNDSWFVLAEGKYLVQNGVHYTDILTIHENMDIVVQNYGFAMIFYIIHSIFGAPGLYISMLILNFLICYLLYKICMLLSNKNVNLSLLIMIVTNLVLALGFVVTRAQMVSYVFFLALIYILELYIKTNKTKYLWWAPLLSVLQINLHASLWWMLIIVMLVYIIDSIKRPKLRLQGYETKPLVIAIIVMFLIGFINPYGIKMITYIFTSYGATEIINLVAEMYPFDLGNFFNITVYASLVITLLLYIFGNKRLIRIRYLLMFFGFLALGLNTIKGLSQFILVMFFPLALMYKDVHIEKIINATIGRKALIIWSSAISIFVFLTQIIILSHTIKNYPSTAMVEAVNVIANNSEDKDVKVYSGYNNGGYVEYRGFKAYLDPRAEVFLKKNNHKENILKEWEDMMGGKVKLDNFLDKYQFDFLLADCELEYKICEVDSSKYQIIYENEEEDLKVYERTKE